MYSIKVKFTKRRGKKEEGKILTRFIYWTTFHLLDCSFDHELYFMAFLKKI